MHTQRCFLLKTRLQSRVERRRVLRWLAKSTVKDQGLFLNRRWKLVSLSTVGAEGISGEELECIEIGKNTNGESTPMGRY